MGLSIFCSDGEKGAALFAAIIAAACSMTLVLSLYCNVMYEMKTMEVWHMGKLMRYDAEGGLVIAVSRIENGVVNLEELPASGIVLNLPGTNVSETVSVSIIPNGNGTYRLHSLAVCDADKEGDFPKSRYIDAVITRDDSGKIKMTWG